MAVGRNEILGVLMTFVAHYSCNLNILVVLYPTFPFISRNIGGAIAHPVPTSLLKIMMMVLLHVIFCWFIRKWVWIFFQVKTMRSILF